jgi:signal transduction histidine kinase
LNRVGLTRHFKVLNLPHFKEHTVVEEVFVSDYLTDVHQQLWQSMLKCADQSAAQERQRIARDLHDSVGHALTSLNLKLQTAMKLCQPDPISAQDYLTEAHELVAIAAQEVRQSIRTLRQEPDQTSLSTLVEPLLQDFYATTAILPQVTWDESVALPTGLITTFYRVIQEALNNCRKYAQASSVEIHLTSNADGVSLSICDNGRGFDAHQVFSSYGLRGMKERLEMHQGRLLIQTHPGQGCEIIAQIAHPTAAHHTPINHTPIVAAQMLPIQTPTTIGPWVSFSLDSWSF